MELEEKQINWIEDTKMFVKHTTFLLFLIPILSFILITIKLGDLIYRRNDK